MGRRMHRTVAALGLTVLLALMAGLPAGAVATAALTLTTPYPAVAVAPGSKVSFDLTIQTPTTERVGLAVKGTPPGWTASLFGGGFVVDGVLTTDPKLAVGDGALGFWKALPQVFPSTRTQRCWVHKTANVLNKLPKKLHGQAKDLLHQIWMASTKADANKSFDLFVTTYQPKYPGAAECLSKDKDALLAFYDFPAEHWLHLRTTNPIESTFATVRLRTEKTKGCGSRVAGLTMVFKLAESAGKGWRSLNGSALIQDVIAGVVFVDGIKPESIAA